MKQAHTEIPQYNSTNIEIISTVANGETDLGLGVGNTTHMRKGYGKLHTSTRYQNRQRERMFPHQKVIMNMRDMEYVKLFDPGSERAKYSACLQSVAIGL